MVGATRKIGKVCAKHPEVAGARYANNQCIECQMDYNARWRAVNREKYNVMRAKIQKRYRKDQKYKKERQKLIDAHKARLAAGTVGDV